MERSRWISALHGVNHLLTIQRQSLCLLHDPCWSTNSGSFPLIIQHPLSSIRKVEPEGNTPMDAEAGAASGIDRRWLANEPEVSQKARKWLISRISRIPG